MVRPCPDRAYVTGGWSAIDSRFGGTDAANHRDSSRCSGGSARESERRRLLVFSKGVVDAFATRIDRQRGRGCSGDVFPTWKNWKLVEDNAEVAPGVRILTAPGHTPGHSAFLVTSGKDQLMVSNDAMYVPALLAPHPDWQGAYDQDGATAVATRRKLIDRVIADKMMVCGAHFPFPGSGTFTKDGNAYAFAPVVQS